MCSNPCVTIQNIMRKIGAHHIADVVRYGMEMMSSSFKK